MSNQSLQRAVDCLVVNAEGKIRETSVQMDNALKDLIKAAQEARQTIAEGKIPTLCWVRSAFHQTEAYETEKHEAMRRLGDLRDASDALNAERVKAIEMHNAAARAAQGGAR